jgi:hypothetical protein
MRMAKDLRKRADFCTGPSVAGSAGIDPARPGNSSTPTRQRLPQYVLMALLSMASVFGHGYASRAQVQATPRYVGAIACQSCHTKEYKAFTSYAKKSSSFQSVNRLRKELTDEEIQSCYVCHTTGYGKPGGFINEEATPELRNAGCEVCHGPGEFHVKTQDPEDIKGNLTERDCEVCHTSERVKAFRYKPLIRGGAH